MISKALFSHVCEHIPSYAGHSLRAGFCTHAAIVGVPEHLIMAQAGHKKSDTTKKYIRIANKWQENAAMKLCRLRVYSKPTQFP